MAQPDGIQAISEGMCTERDVSPDYLGWSGNPFAHPATMAGLMENCTV